MKQKLSLQNIVGMGFMVFAMFLGAGNLIFPPMVGQLAGQDMWYAAAGFLLTGVGLPLLGIVAIARVGGGFNEISGEMPRALIIALGSCIYLIIGPLYAVPRTALVSFEVGITPFLAEPDKPSQLIFSLIFFSISWYLSIRPGKLLESVGELITPALIALLVILGLSPIFSPLGVPGQAMDTYTESPVIKGFLEGYMTMDALAALMFGIVIITNLKSHGIEDKSSLFHYSIITGIIAAAGLALVYLSLFYLGATSREVAPDPDNGGQILTIYAETLFGTTGIALLAAVVTLACLTTAIGCITAASEYFDEMFERVSYRTIVTIISIICVFFANMELNEIIDLFIPVLLILYPISITLIFLGLIRDWLPRPVLTYRATLAVIFIFSIIDALRIKEFAALQPVLQPFSMIPGYEVHMVWLLPSLAVLIITVLIGLLTKPASNCQTP
ncbi:MULTISPECIES: branched-chain amino acid transport system II carrier protein [Gammaproteobacteria]|uniref:branched-chain amino acid transport system II carrier protein n=1 Tax=Gammaproteobacteria TaxID=1236 RepID=UPI001ADB0546|nr:MULTISPECIES: branched-chain amino acid transport system II carrier protein [Gammaproteobacteria]MBO9480196.1 branched-chain amino acid transport system II carrier protein [Salinisphaera sp. G21_0]MBO9493443.1 branched-chain amino acid transport system II carrier protein [Thalassotalea sp. G20_0]